jgi:MFS family permease
VQFAAPFFSVYLVEVLGATAGVVGILMAIQNLAALPGQALYGRWLDRRGIKWTHRLSGLIIPVLPWMWLLATGPWGILPVRIGTGFLYAGYNLANFNMLLLITPRSHRTRYIALYRTIVQSAAAVAPLLGGLAVERFGFATVFVISGLGRLISGLLLQRFVREPRATPAPATG